MEFDIIIELQLKGIEIRKYYQFNKIKNFNINSS